MFLGLQFGKHIHKQECVCACVRVHVRACLCVVCVCCVVGGWVGGCCALGTPAWWQCVS